MPKLLTPAQIISIAADVSLGATKNVSAASNASPIVVTTAVDHLLETGNWALILAVGGNTNAIGLHKVTKVDHDNFSIAVAGNAAYTSGGTVQKLGRDGLIRLLKPWQVKALVDALDRVAHVEGTDDGAGAGESDLKTILGLT